MKILPEGLEAQTREKWPAATGVSQHTVTTTEVVEKMKKRKKLAWLASKRWGRIFSGRSTYIDNASGEFNKSWN